MGPGHASGHAPIRPSPGQMSLGLCLPPEPSRCRGYAQSLATPPGGPQAWPRPQPWSCRNAIPSVAIDAKYSCAVAGSSVPWKIQSHFSP